MRPLSRDEALEERRPDFADIRCARALEDTTSTTSEIAEATRLGVTVAAEAVLSR